MENNLNQKNIILTGATSGIGNALAKELVRLNANLAICGRSKDKMERLLSETINDKIDCYHEVFDITSVSELRNFMKNSLNHFGKIDVLVNCAGANTERAMVKDIDVNELEYMLKLNAVAPLICMQEVYGNMVENNGGLIINVLSTVCQFSNEGIGAYTASKTALDAISKVFRKESRNDKIRISSVYPGGVDTPFREASRPDYLSSDTVASSIVTIIQSKENTCIDELVVRPIIEKNYT